MGYNMAKRFKIKPVIRDTTLLTEGLKKVYISNSYIKEIISFLCTEGNVLIAQRIPTCSQDYFISHEYNSRLSTSFYVPKRLFETVQPSKEEISKEMEIGD